MHGAKVQKIIRANQFSLALYTVVLLLHGKNPAYAAEILFVFPKSTVSSTHTGRKVWLFVLDVEDSPLFERGDKEETA